MVSRFYFSCLLTVYVIQSYICVILKPVLTGTAILKKKRISKESHLLSDERAIVDSGDDITKKLKYSKDLATRFTSVGSIQSQHMDITLTTTVESRQGPLRCDEVVVEVSQELHI